MLPRPPSQSNKKPDDPGILRRDGTNLEPTATFQLAQRDSVRRRGRINRRSLTLFTGALIISVLAHLGSAVKLGTYQNANPLLRPSSHSKKSIKMRVISNKSRDSKELPILEVKQQETLPPTEATHFGQVNHRTDKETRISEKIPRPKGADAGAAGDSVQSRPASSAVVGEKMAANSATSDASKTEVIQSRPTLTINDSDVTVRTGKQRRQAYEALLPRSTDELSGQVKAGYQDHLDDRIAEGERIDINTREYRYIGYFSNMRKTIELVWNYPRTAVQRRLEGEALLEFAIARNGSASEIKVLESSGFEDLDEGIVKAIRLASPFSPLPDNLGKEQLVVTGTFRYVLQPFTAH